MKTTPYELFPIPEKDDFASPLEMQAMAESIDAKLWAQYLLLNALTYPDFSFQQMPANQAIASGPNFGLTMSSVFASGNMAGSNGNFFPRKTGLYTFGYYIASNPTGAVNVGSRRNVSLNLQDLRGADGTVFYTESWATEKYESNTGGEYQTGTATFPIYNMVTAQVNLNVLHSNTSSTVNYLAGSYAFGVRLGDIT